MQLLSVVGVKKNCVLRAWLEPLTSCSNACKSGALPNEQHLQLLGAVAQYNGVL